MTLNRIPTEFQIQGGSVDGNYDSVTMDTAFERMYMGSIRFFDASGNQVTPSAGSVTVTASADGVNFQGIANNAFNAADAYLTSRTFPSASGPMRKVRVTLAEMSLAAWLIA